MSTKTSILKGMKCALINAHNSNNAKAISKDFAAGSGTPEKVFNSWCTWVETLHYKVTPWAEKWNDGKVTDAEINAIYDEVMPILRQLERVDDKLFLRSNEVGAICKMVHDFGKSENGSIDVVKGKVAFRRQIETMIGNRIAQNEAVTEDEYKVITKYDSAVKNQEKAENRLNGYTDKKGALVKGLRDQLKEAEKIYADMKIACGITAKIEADLKKAKKNLYDEYPVITGYMEKVIELENAVKSTEGQISKCKETIQKYGKQYKELMAKISRA